MAWFNTKANLKLRIHLIVFSNGFVLSMKIEMIIFFRNDARVIFEIVFGYFSYRLFTYKHK